MTDVDTPAIGSETFDRGTRAAAQEERIAIVGLAGRFPGANDIDAFWQLLHDGRSGLRTVDDAELTRAGVDPATSARPDYVRVWGGFDDPTGFDAGFFGYAPREAALLDPQHRVFLECAWAALEHAGYDSRAFAGRIGVYAGGALTYHFSHIHADPALRESVDPLHAGLSNVLGMIAARTAYHMDLKGPCVGVQATCATSLIAVHLAARSLLAGEADMVLAGAVAVGQPRPEGYVYKSEGVVSPDGLCRPFDAAAQGTVFSNGVGVVVLRRLRDALADGDTIHAVLRGSAMGNDGAAKVGLTAPSVAGQVAVLEAALADARIAPSSVDYVETHGTATVLGDPIELAALNRVYGPGLDAEGRVCGIGSVKGNVGHMDVAAGMGGLIKSILALRHETLPASINFAAPNPGFDLPASPFRVVTENRPWGRTPDRPRRAAISAFGMGGMNAHVILEEPPGQPPASAVAGPHLLRLSARDAEALARMRRALAAAIGAEDGPALADVAHTLHTGRRPMGRRFACLAHSRAEAVALLERGEGPACVEGEALPGTPSLVFLFPGQGAQYPGMARALLEHEPEFRSAFEACLDLLPDTLDLRAVLYGDAETLRRTQWTQPALFVVEYALARMWLAKGLRPRALIGHSIGEYVAACLAGVFSLADALRLVCARGTLMQACAPGAMLSVALSEAEARALVSPEVDLAVVNGPRSCVLAGTLSAISALAADVEQRGIGSRLLKTSHAFHSFMMEPALAPFSRLLSEIPLHPPTLDIVSNLTGEWLTAGQATDPTYWVAQLRQAVRFGPALSRALEVPNPLLLEVGPGATLTRLAAQPSGPGLRAVTSLPDTAEQDAAEHVALARAHLWVAGLETERDEPDAGATPRRVGLPTYPFRRESFWVPPASPVQGEIEAPGRRADLATWFHQPLWRRCAAPRAGDAELPRARWLLLGGAAALAAIGTVPAQVEVISVEAAAGFAPAGAGFDLDPADPDHYRALFTELAARDIWPDQIINAFPLDPAAAPQAPFTSVFALGRALTTLDERPAVLTVLARGMQQVTGGEVLAPAAAMALGALRVLPQEVPYLQCRSVDLPAAAASPVAGLRAALTRPWQKDATVLALRGGFLWREEVTATPLTEPAEVPALSAGATYLVVGDLTEGLGLIYVRALVKSLRARVVVVGRAGLPPAEEWEHWLASHSPQHPVSRFVRALRDIGVPGRDYLLFSGDLTDPDWLCGCIADSQRRFGPIQGVFHTAGMGEGHHCPLAEATPEQAGGLFATKIAGMTALADAIAGIAPRFVLVQSSFSTVVGGVGLVAYAAANSFLDAFVDARREAGPAMPEATSWQAIDWDTCLPYGQGREDLGGSLAAPFAHAMDGDEVWRVTRAVLARPDVSRVAVTPEPLERRMAAAAQVAMVDAGNTARSARPDRATGGPPRDAVEAAVATIMGELLGIEGIGVDDNFFALGGHSLLAVQVVMRLRKHFATELPMRALLFEAPTVAGIAAVIRGSLETAQREQETLAALLDEIEADGQRQEA